MNFIGLNPPDLLTWQSLPVSASRHNWTYE